MCTPNSISTSILSPKKIGDSIATSSQEAGQGKQVTTTTTTTMINMVPPADHHHHSPICCSDRSFATTATSATCSSEVSVSGVIRGILLSNKHPEKDNNNNTVHLPLMKRQVSFHEVQIRRYPMVIGDHPEVQMGAPVTIDWEYEELPSVDLDDFEAARCPQRRTKLRQLILNYYHRRAILTRLGYSIPQQKEASKEVSKIKRQRSVTRMLHPVSKLEEIAQSAKRKMNRQFKATITT